jgi:hypothetical protein
VRREAHANQRKTGQQGHDQTKEARSFRHLVDFTPRTVLHIVRCTQGASGW